jgi:glycosyltransferase involved in cell wall biosynthesis
MFKISEDRILVNPTPLDTEHRFRGIGRYVKGLLDGFDKLDCRFCILRQSRRLGVYGKVVSSHFSSTTIRRPPRPRLRWDWLWNEIWLKSEVESLRVQLYHATDLAGIPISPQFRTVATVHDLIPLEFSRSTSNLPFDYRLGYSTSLRKLRRANHLIAISEFTKQDVVSRLGVDPESITVVPLAVDLEEFSQLSGRTAQEVRTVYDLPAKYMLYVGALEEHKRVPLAIAAATRAKVPLVIVGQHTPEQQRHLAETVERLHAGPFVRYLGYVPGEDLPLIYRNANVFVFPSVYEGFGLPILEAMAAGCPVVTTSAASLPEVAGDAAVVLPPDDLEALVEAVSEIAEHNDLQRRLIKAGTARAKEFTWEETARQTLRVYERVLDVNDNPLP